MSLRWTLSTAAACLIAFSFGGQTGSVRGETPAVAGEVVDFASLLAEMVDRDRLARFPRPMYRQLQASSYNRQSVARDQPGWFADSDGLGFIRTETINGRTEWVLMEHDGPGAVVKLWTPYFYYGLGNRGGPNLRFYLDGAATPQIDCNFIELVTAKTDLAREPLAAETMRAGNCYLPIPFARSCKITTTAKPFYYIINYRAYDDCTPVRTFDAAQITAAADVVARVSKQLVSPPDATGLASQRFAGTIASGDEATLALPDGGGAVRRLKLVAPEAPAAALRNLVLQMTFDQQQAVWCPVGDFFCAADRLHRFRMWSREVTDDGEMICRWVMPYQQSGVMTLKNLGQRDVRVELVADVGPWRWDDRSMHFRADWRHEAPQPTMPMRDWNFIEIDGQGVLVGDSWTVLTPMTGWWGEGDEKIYVDLPPDAPFPTHFGTGSEDYYGWAGGVVPEPDNAFAEPLVGNIRVGGTPVRTRGFNVCTRARALDAVPFERRLRFDMEASAGTGERSRSIYYQYTGVTYWYGRPGARCNREPQVEAASQPLPTADDLAALSAAARQRPKRVVAGAIEFEKLRPVAVSDGLRAGPQRPAEAFGLENWSDESHFFIASAKAGDFVEFRITEQFQPQHLTLYVTKSYDFGLARLSVNGKVLREQLDLYHASPIVEPLKLGVVTPQDNAVTIRLELLGPNPRSRGSRTFMGLDCAVLEAP